MISLVLLNLFLIIIFPIHGATPEAILTFSKKCIDKASFIVSLRLNQQFKSNPLQDYSGQAGKVKYSIHNSTFQQDLIQPPQIEFTFFEDQSNTQMKWVNLSGSAIMNIDYEITPAKGTSKVQASYSGAYSLVALTIQKDIDGRPKAIETGDLTLSNDQISLSFNGTDTDLIKGPLTPILTAIVVSEFKDFMQKVIQEQGDILNQNFSQIPLDNQVYKTIYMHSSLLEDPKAKSDYYISKIDAFSFYINQTNSNKTVESKTLPLLDPSISSDVQLFVSSAFFQNILDTQFAAGMLSHEYQTSFLGRIITLACYASRSPNFIVLNKLSIDSSGQCNITYIGLNRQYLLSIAFDVKYEFNISIINSTLFLSINNQTSGLSDVRMLSPFANELVWLKGLFNSLFMGVTNAINLILKNNGINLGRFFPFPLKNIYKSFKTDYIATYFDLQV